MEPQTIPMSGAYDLVVGPTPPVAAPHRAALRRLRRRIRHYLQQRPPSEWHQVDDRKLEEQLAEPGVDVRFVRTELSRAMAERFPDLPCFRLELADALVEAGELDEALAVAGRLYREYEDMVQAEELIVKLLDHLDRPLDDFPWRDAAPSVARLDQSTLDRCHHYLLANGVSDLWTLTNELFLEEIRLFDAPALAQQLANDPRFELIAEHGDTVIVLSDRAEP